MIKSAPPRGTDILLDESKPINKAINVLTILAKNTNYNQQKMCQRSKRLMWIIGGLTIVLGLVTIGNWVNSHKSRALMRDFALSNGNQLDRIERMVYEASQAAQKVIIIQSSASGIPRSTR